MNILVIGNGFDLAHGLPTKYTDFLEWVKIILTTGETLNWVTEMPCEENKLNEWLKSKEQPKQWKFNFEKLFEKFLINIENRGGFKYKNSRNIKKIFKESNIRIDGIRVGKEKVKEALMSTVKGDGSCKNSSESMLRSLEFLKDNKNDEIYKRIKKNYQKKQKMVERI